ncbi:hypothetical protein Q8W71_06830 [Methylobacterium sp. NEAU 140]|uniref:hypothetical protein n=1 Tax=Methylobacterium sp. NEAU 140 TaxID=3064945 RepID=UPI002733E7FD|nr:hypothetical protein [Methylobacterium sp. NEAU 140]MDP4022331.1 hypothetical protein [Methylobacterium sp. NEAU 140]
MMRLPELPPEFRPAPARPPLLARVISEMAAAGVRVSPLGVLCRLTDLGADDDEVAKALDQLTAAGPIEGALHG